MSTTTSTTAQTRRIAAGHYAVIGTDLEITRVEWELHGIDCEHPLCERFHPQRRVNGEWVCAAPDPVRIQWEIMLRGERHGQCEGYATKRDAIAAAKRIQRQYVDRGI